MDYIERLAKHWEDHNCSFDARDILPNGDEVWVYSTLELGLPVLWLKHPNGNLEHYVIHTEGYDKPTGEHWRGMKIYGDARNVVMSYMTRMLNYAVPQLRKRAIPMMLSQKKSGWTPIIERIRIYHKMNVTMKVFD